MANKFILQKLENNEVTNSKEYKSLKDITKALNIAYHQVRLLYLFGKQERPNKLHPFLKEVARTYRIIDNPNLKVANIINFDE